MSSDVPDREPAPPLPEVRGRLHLILRALAEGPLDDDTPHQVVSQVAAALGAQRAVVRIVNDDRLDVLAGHGDDRDQESSDRPLRLGDLSLPLTFAATTGEAVWLGSQAETEQRFPAAAGPTPRPDRAFVALPLSAAGAVLGVLGLGFESSRTFGDEDRTFLLALADVCAVHLHQWQQVASVQRRPTSAATLGRLVLALTGADTADEVARVIAEEGASSAAAVFANIAILGEDDEDTGTARMIHAPSLDADIATRYTEVGVDSSTPLGVALSTGGEVWLRSLTDVDASFPDLSSDTRAAGLAATASLPLRDSEGQMIGALGLGWAAPQRFADDQRDEIRVVAQLAADGLRRARKRDRLVRVTAALNENAARLGALQAVTAALARATTTDDIAQVVVSEGIALVADHGVAAMLSLDGHSLRTWTSSEVVGHLPETPAVVPLTADLALAAAVRQDRSFQARTRAEVTALSQQSGSVVDSAGTHSVLIVPAHADGRPIGALALGFTREHAVDDAVVAFAGALADLMGQALQRAAQYERQAHAAQVLQRSLLPTLPDVAGLELAATYLPGDHGAQVGGDWYDVIDLGEGRVHLAIGDVMGHDMRAAAVMGQLRAAVHAYADVAHSPAQVLARLHAMVDDLPDIDLVTCLCAIYDTVAGRLTVANAGHLPLLVTAPGRPTVRTPPASGPPLGAGTGDYREHSLDVAPGTLLTLLTDGVVEVRGEDIEDALDQLAAFLDGNAHRPLTALATDTLAQLGTHHVREDDAALLLVR